VARRVDLTGVVEEEERKVIGEMTMALGSRS
jgi:hypothetical protein